MQWNFEPHTLSFLNGSQVVSGPFEASPVFPGDGLVGAQDVEDGAPSVLVGSEGTELNMPACAAPIPSPGGGAAMCQTGVQQSGPGAQKDDGDQPPQSLHLGEDQDLRPPHPDLPGPGLHPGGVQRGGPTSIFICFKNAVSEKI